MTNELIFYDIEVYPHDAFVVFKDLEGTLQEVFSTRDERGFKGLEEYITGKTLIGYNNYWYDDKILTKMIQHYSAHQLKELNDEIIVHKKQVRAKLPCKSLDVFQQIAVSMPSLKKIEANMGKSIMESPVDFNIPRPLTEEEYQEALEYCKYDIDMTIEVYKMRIESYFQPKESLVEMLGNENAMKWNTTTISANLLLDKPLVKWSGIRIPEDIYQDFNDSHPQIMEMWEHKDKGKTTITEFDCDIEFGFGGLHGVNNNNKKFKNVKLLDVKSMYPFIILNIKALGIADEKYRAILERRIAVKGKDHVLADALKLILNSVYGNLKNKFSTLNNPKAALSVCVYGQIALYELGRRLSATCEIVQLNTDGIAFTTDTEDYKLIWKQWEKDFSLELEEENYDLFIQRDVNNYVAVSPDGKVKCKGGDVSRYSEDKPFANNSARILDIALVEKLINDIDPIETLMKHMHEPKLFQCILQAGGTFQGTFDDNGKQCQKINRVFAANNSVKDAVTLKKKRYDGALVLFPDSPSKMFIWNDDISKIEDFEKIVDLNHYYQIINKRLEKWSV